MKHTAQKVVQRKRRHARIRATLRGTPERPRLAFFVPTKMCMHKLLTMKQERPYSAFLHLEKKQQERLRMQKNGY